MTTDIEKEKAFLAELAAVCQKYGVAVVESDSYDHEENVCGTSWWFEGPGIMVTLEELWQTLP